MEIDFKTKNDKQIQAAEYWCDDEVEQLLYGGAKGGGKSYLGAAMIFGDALMYPGTRYFIARKELNDLRKHTTATIYEFLSNVRLIPSDDKERALLEKIKKLDARKLAPYNGQDNFFRLYNGSQVFFLACAFLPSDPMFERLGSMPMTRGWIEEGGEVVETAKDQLWLSVGRWKNEEYNIPKKMLITANPKKGWLKRDFVDPFQEKNLTPSKKYIQALATDNTYNSTSYLESLSNQRDTVSRQRLWEGRWDYDDDLDAIVAFDALTDAFTNTIDSEDERYLIVDVARKGRDTTVFSFWEDLELYKIVVKQKQTTDRTEQDVKDFAAAHRIPYSHILVDEDGIGGGVVDHLPGVKGFTANSVPIATAAQIREKQAKASHDLVPKTAFGNLKAQCGWKLAELLNEHKVRMAAVQDYRERIIEELAAILRDRTPDGEGKKLLRSKEDVKQEIGRSPDIGDTIVMRAYFELVEDAAAATNDPKRAQAVQEQTIRLRRNSHNRSLRSNK